MPKRSGGAGTGALWRAPEIEHEFVFYSRKEKRISFKTLVLACSRSRLLHTGGGGSRACFLAARLLSIAALLFCEPKHEIIFAHIGLFTQLWVASAGEHGENGPIGRPKQRAYPSSVREDLWLPGLPERRRRAGPRRWTTRR